MEIRTGTADPRARAASGPSLAAAALLIAAIAVVTIGRAAVESRARLAAGIAAEAAGDRDAARLRFGEARAWRLPLFPWAAQATRRLERLPADGRATLGGTDPGAAPGTSPRFGRAPSSLLALVGGLALVAAYAAAARWAWTGRRPWGAITLASGALAALALWIA